MSSRWLNANEIECSIIQLRVDHSLQANDCFVGLANCIRANAGQRDELVAFDA